MMIGRGFVLTQIPRIEQTSQIQSIGVNVGKVKAEKMIYEKLTKKGFYNVLIRGDVFSVEEAYNSLPTVGMYVHEIVDDINDLKIKKVIFNNPATIILWKDGTKTVVKCNKKETYDPEKGFAMCIAEKLLGSYSAVKRIIRKYSPETETTLKQFSKQSGIKIGYSIENTPE